MTQNRTPQPSPEAIGEPVDVVAMPDERIPAVPADVANSSSPPVPAAPALAPKVVPGLLEPQLVPIGDLVPDAGNARRHPEKNLRAIRDSLSQFGQRKPLVVQRQEDGTLEAARQLGWATVAVTIVDEDNATAARFAIADNRTGELAEWDDEALAAMLDGIDEGSRGLLGFDADDMADLTQRLIGVEDGQGDGGGEGGREGVGGEKTLSDTYTKKIAPPVYEPRGENPPIADLFDSSKTDSLISEIDAAQIPSDVDEFLRIAAQRHTSFSYRKIAEFYAHASPEVQDLMERSALVIIDYNKAVENGFVRLTERLGSIADSELAKEGGEGEGD